MLNQRIRSTPHIAVFNKSLQCFYNIYSDNDKNAIKTSPIPGCLRSGLTGGFLLLQNFSVVISVSLHVCFISALILISMFLR